MQGEHPGAESRDLILPPGSYAYVQADNSGAIKTNVGPTVVTLSGQDRPVVYDAQKRTFRRCGQEQAVQTNVWADEGDYVILENPARKADSPHPDEGGARPTPPEGLEMGKRIVIPGPCTFALWPGQNAKTVKGHHLLSNQFLLVRVYNETAARDNWGQGIKTSAKTDDDKGEEGEKVAIRGASTLSDIKTAELKLGQLLIIPGNEVSFYIPPTGVEVVQEKGQFVRDAVTLERLEYCILVDEDGEKRYERGPAVIFPKPTEEFVTHDGMRKFKAIELTKMAGLHIKVIADYEEDGKTYKAGEELFITGKDQSIYFPRIEHSIIRYDNRDKHYAVAIPRGEGRYMMDRDTGKIDTVHGPTMLLADPRNKVIVRRILSEKEVRLWYPGNNEALAHNRSLAAVAQEVERARGYVSARHFRKSADFDEVEMLDSAIAGASEELVSDEFERGTQFTPPRSITLDTKYDGVPAISVWTGYAVQVVNKDDSRRVVEGPSNILLEYDECLEILELSTGKPKNTDKLQRTVYLRTRNNKVSDIVAVETKDHVQVDVKLSMLVNFEGDSDKWFQVENYVKLLCDHVRSVLKGKVKKIGIEEFYEDHVSIIRDSILGESAEGKRSGMQFEENGMVVRDVEILGFTIKDAEVARLLNEAQFAVVASNIDREQAERNHNIAMHKARLERLALDARAETEQHRIRLDEDIRQQRAEINMAALETTLAEATKRKDISEAEQASTDIDHKAQLDRKDAEIEQAIRKRTQESEIDLKELQAEVKAVCDRFGACNNGFSEALLALSRDDVLVKVAKAASVQSMIGGDSFADVVKNIFEGTPLGKVDVTKWLGAALKDLPAPSEIDA